MLEQEEWCERLCNTKDKNSNTPLHVAAMQGNQKSVQLLVNHKAKTDAINQEDKTPVHLAAEKGWWRSVSFYT